MRVFVIFLMLLLVPVVSACAKPGAAPVKPLQTAQSSPTKSVPPAPLPDTSINSITRAAANAGVRTCLERIEKVSNFIVNNTQSKFVMSIPPADADRQITSASFEVQLPSKAVAYATMTAAPTTDGSCDVIYEAVAYWDKSCTLVSQENYSKAKPLGVVQQKISVLSVGPTIRVFLMPAGQQGCVSIKKEVVY